MRKYLTKIIFGLCLAIFIIPKISAGGIVTCEYTIARSPSKIKFEFEAYASYYELKNWTLTSPGGTHSEFEPKFGEDFYVRTYIYTNPDADIKDHCYCPPYLKKNNSGEFVVADYNSAVYSYNSSGSSYKYIGRNICPNYKSENSCRSQAREDGIACVWNKNDSAKHKGNVSGEAGGDRNGYCNVDNLLYVGCGGASDIPVQVPSIISLVVNLLKIATPIILIFISIITLMKALAAGKEDEIKKATNSLVKKIIAAALVFFIIGIVQFVMSKVAEDDDYEGITDCLNCFLNNKCTVNTYYKTVVGGEDMCTFLTKGETKSCKDLFK